MVHLLIQKVFFKIRNTFLMHCNTFEEAKKNRSCIENELITTF